MFYIDNNNYVYSQSLDNSYIYSNLFKSNSMLKSANYHTSFCKFTLNGMRKLSVGDLINLEVEKIIDFSFLQKYLKALLKEIP